MDEFVKHSEWSDNELKRLRELYQAGVYITDISYLLDRTVRSIRNCVSILGYTRKNKRISYEQYLEYAAANEDLCFNFRFFSNLKSAKEVSKRLQNYILSFSSTAGSLLSNRESGLTRIQFALRNADYDTEAMEKLTHMNIGSNVIFYSLNGVVSQNVTCELLGLLDTTNHAGETLVKRNELDALMRVVNEKQKTEHHEDLY